MTVILQAKGNTEYHVGGQVFRANAAGTISVPDNLAPVLIAQGCIPYGNAVPNCTTAGRPTAGTNAGNEWFDSTLGKPIWRNKTNNGWVDATGKPIWRNKTNNGWVDATGTAV